ncbi:MAG TPA: S-layer homology domain-containing protein [Chloroflexia bacterium]
MSNRNRSHNYRLGALLGLILLIAGLAGVATPLPTASGSPGLVAWANGGGATLPLKLPIPGQRPATLPADRVPAAVNAYAHFMPGPVFTATVGTKFTLDLYVNSGSNTVVGQQSYMTFTNSLLQVVDTSQSGCMPSTSISPDATTFDVLLQNVADNGTGEIAYASGDFDAGAPPSTDFRVAQISFCGSTTGDAVIHWQFSPPAPANRNSKITDPGSNTVSNPAIYVDQVIHIVALTPTPINTSTGTPTSPPTTTPTSIVTNTPPPIPSNTATRTPSNTITVTPSITPSNTATNTPANTATITATLTSIATNTATITPINTPTNTVTATGTITPVGTATNTATNVPSTTPTTAPSNTMTSTATSTPANTATGTPTNTAVPTQTSGGNTATPLPTNTPTAIVTATPTACIIEFSDVPPSSTFYAFIQCLACRGILGGYSDGTFRPNNDVTRGQLSKIVANSAGFNEAVAGQTFQDVPSNSTFYLYIERMARRGIIGGYPCGTVPTELCGSGDRPYFRPNANATRGQISKIVSQAAGYSESHTGQTFEDVPPTNTFYIWIERLASRGFMGGYECGDPGEPCGTGNKAYFRPYNNATRGQTSKIVANTFFPTCHTQSRHP